MRLYLQGTSALEHYRSSSARTFVETQAADVRRLEQATSSLAAFEPESLSWIGVETPSPDHPLEVLVGDPNLRHRSKSVHARAWNVPLPKTAFRSVRKNIYVSSPEFLFLQMATKLKLVDLILLGMELCGTYRRKVRVLHMDTGEASFVTEFEQPVLTTPKRLSGFLKAVGVAPGRQRALAALKYVIAQSASPMETAIYLLLCLPRRLGGYGLPLPKLNVCRMLTASARKFTWRRSARPDLFWEEKELDLEYNSDEFHDEQNRAEDSMRRKALEEQGIEVIELTRREVISEALFHATALRIARRLGKRIQSEDAGTFALRRAELRELVMRDDGEDDEPLELEGTRHPMADPNELDYTSVDGYEGA